MSSPNCIFFILLQDASIWQSDLTGHDQSDLTGHLINMPSVALAVTAVDLKSNSVSGWLVADQQVSMTLVLRLPSSAVEAKAIDVPLKLIEKAALAAAVKDARLKTAALQCAVFCRMQRCLAIKRELLRGTRLALFKVRGSMTVDLGP